jgi:hypothetical protein
MRNPGRRPARDLERAGFLPILLLLLASLSCTLERRGDADLDGGGLVPADTFQAENEGDFSPVGGERPPELDLPSASPGETVLTTLEVFRESVRVGDLSLALSLLHRDAVIADDLADETGTPTTRGEILMELRRRHAEGLRLRLVEDAVQEIDGAYLVVSRWDILHDSGTDEEPDVRGQARESAVLRPSAEGWRIALLHRSRIPSP